MLAIRLKYFLFCCMLCIASCLYSQDIEEQSVITIIGDDDFALNNTNPYEQSNTPPQNQKIINDNQKITSPSLEHGFNMRFESAYSKPAERLGGGGSSFAVNYNMYDDDDEAGQKSTASISERKFNAKKKLRKWLPKRKKKYRPTMCGRW